MRTSILVLNAQFGGVSEAERYILHFSELFTNLGYRITLLYGQKSRPDIFSPVITEIEAPPLASEGHRWSADELNTLAAQAGAVRPDLTFVHDVFHWPVLDAVRRGMPGTPMVWYAHDRFFGLLDSAGAPPRAAPRDDLLPWLEDFAGVSDGRPGRGGMQAALRPFVEFAAGFDAIVVSSAERARQLTGGLRLPAGRVHIVPGRTAQPAPRGADPEGGGILYGGAITAKKRVAELIEAMERIRGVPRLRLVLAGRSFNESYLARCRRQAERSMAAREGLSVEFAPNPDAETLERLYAECDMLVCTCGHSHTFPVAVQEAMERGLPVVAFDLGGINMLVRDRITGLLASPGDMGRLAERVEWMLLHRDEARRMGRLARHLAAWEFHSREHVASLNRLFEELIVHRGDAARVPAKEALPQPA